METVLSSTLTMAVLKSLVFIQLLLAYLVHAHGGVNHGSAATDKEENPNWKYAQRHVRPEVF
jgi:hypothetical protein